MLRLSPLLFFLPLFLLIATSHGEALAQAPEQASTEEARRHFDAATAAFDGGDYPAAVEGFERAYELTHHPDILYNIYSAAERAGQLETALRSLERYLAEGEVEAERRPVLQERLARLRERVVARGAEAVPEPVEPQPAVEPEPERAPSGGVHPAAIGMLIAAGVLAVSFGVFAGLSEAEDGSLAAGCGMRGTCTSEELSTLNALNIAADVSWIAAAAAGVTGVILLFALPPEQSSSAQAAVAPWASPDGAGLVARGSF